MANNELFDYWLNNVNVSDQLKQKMLMMSEDEIDFAFRDEPLKFGTAGYRAVYGPGPIYLNEHTYQQLAVGYAKFLIETTTLNKKERIKVFIGHDNRRDAQKISKLVAEVLSSFDIEVWLMQNNAMVPTPLVSFIVRDLKLNGAINITASHNPKEYNGFKAYNSTGAQVNEEQANKITEFLPNSLVNLNKKYLANFNLIKHLDNRVVERYYDSIEKVLNLTDYNNYFDPIVITTHHGAGSIYARDFLESMGHNIVCVKEQCYEDPEFTNSPNMNPEDDASFALAIKYANEINSGLVIGFDPDADRMAIAVKHHKRWYFLNGNEMGILASYYLIKHKPFDHQKVPVMVSTFVSNNLIDRIANYYQGFVFRTATGFKNIAQAMDMIDLNDSEYLIGFEEAVGMNISLDTREKDGLAAAGLAIEMYNFYKQQNQTLIDILWYRIFQAYGQWFGKTISLKIPGNDWKIVANQLEAKVLSMNVGTKFEGFKIENITYIKEGNCIEWDLGNDNWIKFRISGTEPKFKIYYNLYFENDEFIYEYDKYNKIVDKITKTIQEKVFK